MINLAKILAKIRVIILAKILAKILVVNLTKVSAKIPVVNLTKILSKIPVSIEKICYPKLSQLAYWCFYILMKHSPLV